MSVKILIVDDHEVVREGIRTLIMRARPQWQLCGDATNAQEAIEACRRLKPDVTVLDITMPGMSGLEAASAIFALGSRVLMFTMHESEQLAAEVALAGAQGFVLKSQAGKDLIRAIERLLGGGTFFGSESDPQEQIPDPPPSGRLAGSSSGAGMYLIENELIWCMSANPSVDRPEGACNREVDRPAIYHQNFAAPFTFRNVAHTHYGDAEGLKDRPVSEFYGVTGQPPGPHWRPCFNEADTQMERQCDSNPPLVIHPHSRDEHR